MTIIFKKMGYTEEEKKMNAKHSLWRHLVGAMIWIHFWMTKFSGFWFIKFKYKEAISDANDKFNLNFIIYPKIFAEKIFSFKITFHIFQCWYCVASPILIYTDTEFVHFHKNSVIFDIQESDAHSIKLRAFFFSLSFHSH